MFYKFILKMKHDKGFINIATHAQDYNAAKAIVLAAERAPERSIKSAVCVDANGFELALYAPTERVVLSIPEPSLRTMMNLPLSHGATRWRVRTIDSRWRRVYRKEIEGNEMLFVWHGEAKTLVHLPGVKHASR